MYVEKTMTAAAVVEHCKEVNALLTEVGYSTRRRAGLLGKSAQTLKQYSVSPESAQYRRIPSEDLDMLRATAIEEFWRRQWNFLSKWAAAEGFNGMSALPIRYRIVNGQTMMAAGVTHFFRPRIQEIADETGGEISSLSIAPHETIPSGVGQETERAAKRSRWRKAVFALRKVVRPEDVKTILTDITGYCEYSVLRIGIEYLPFRIPPQDRWIAALKERMAS